jgi:hypothetical protein
MAHIDEQAVELGGWVVKVHKPPHNLRMAAINRLQQLPWDIVRAYGKACQGILCCREVPVAASDSQ